jgi:hypothetical protein
MLYGAPEVPGQEKEPVQRVAQALSYFKGLSLETSGFSKNPPRRFL